MKPDLPAVLTDLADKLRNNIVPELQGFRAGSVSMTAAMLDMVVDRWDAAAHHLVEENEAIVRLLARGAPLVGTPAAPACDRADLRISSLSRLNDNLREALTNLHELVEGRKDEASQDLNRDIWVELRRSVNRRTIRSANF